jgi:hypothetical protein
MPRAKRAQHALSNVEGDAKFGNLFLFFAFFAGDIPNFGCGSVALCLGGQTFLRRKPAGAKVFIRLDRRAAR